MTALGLMSGTSMDGIDLAMIETDGERVLGRGPYDTVPYAAPFRARLAEAVRAGSAAPAELVAELDAAITDLHAAAVLRFLARWRVDPAAVRVVGFHGHTLYHAPERHRTRQLGDPGQLAARLGIDTVGDFRQADVAAGGQGAPLAPLYHAALARELDRPMAVLNLGGVANVTWIGRGDPEDDGALVAFDTGPANVLIDELVARRTGRAYDENGALAASGRADAAALAALLDHPYFAAPPPKSLDRYAFSADPVAGLGDADAAATLVAFTAATVARARDLLPAAPDRWLVTGGGRLNRTLMGALRAALGVPVEPVEAIGWEGDALEAQAFAFLAVRALLDRPLTLPGTTGAPRPLTGGSIHRAGVPAP
ncbi:MAG: anhydro-N-acetylmuramic acid kinase [Azospirillaceae bacterium]